jgi:hypothetical protein
LTGACWLALLPIVQVVGQFDENAPTRRISDFIERIHKSQTLDEGRIGPIVPKQRQ